MHNLEHAGWICHSVDHCCASGGHCACLGAADIFNIDQQHVAAVEAMADNSRRLNWARNAKVTAGGARTS